MKWFIFDILISLCVTALILAIWIATIFYSSPPSVIDDKSATAVVGALLTITGILARQYCLQDVLAYLVVRRKLLSALRRMASQTPTTKLVALANEGRAHEKYINLELHALNLVPYFLVTALGVLVFASEGSNLRPVALSLLVLLVCYVSRATATSTVILAERIEQETLLKFVEEAASGAAGARGEEAL